jgi:SAM-dependent methyltransferase
MNSPWDARYANQEALYGKEPNAFFAQALSQFEGGSILLPCDGEGRNGLFAARQGWDVHAFDSSQVGVDTAQRWADEAGVSMHCTVCDAFGYAPPQPCDVVGLFYSHMPSDRRMEFHQRAIDWLKPGGTLILEGFHRDQLPFQSGGPRDEAMLFTPEMLALDFCELAITQNEFLEVILDEGPLHQGKACVTRFVGTKR